MHRCILAPRCEFFYACFDGGFEEEQTASVEMHDDDPEILGRLLKWLYTLELPRNEGSWTSDLQLWLLADKYGLEGLLNDCKHSIIERARNCAKDEQKFAEDAEDFVQGMETLFLELPTREDVKEIRDDVVEILATTVARNMRQLPELEDIMKDVPGFGVLLVETLSRQAYQRRRSSTTSLGSISAGSGSSVHLSRQSPLPTGKVHIPLNEDSEDEF